MWRIIWFYFSSGGRECTCSNSDFFKTATSDFLEGSGDSVSSKNDDESDSENFG